MSSLPSATGDIQGVQPASPQRRAVVQALAALAVSAGSVGAVQAARGGQTIAPPVSLLAPEPMAQLHIDATGTLWAVARRGTLWRLLPAAARSAVGGSVAWQQTDVGLDAATPIASGHGWLAARDAEGGLRVRSTAGAAAGPAARTSAAQLAPDAGLLVLAGAVVGVVRAGANHHVARFEAAPDGSWHERARSAEAVTPDARPILYERDGTGPSPDADGDVVVAGAPSTDRYRHAILGDAIEPTALLHLERHSLRLRGRLDVPAPYVFEDIAPRPVKYGDRRALLTVRSGPLGAQLVLVTADPTGDLHLSATGEPLGTLHRWLAPTTDGARLAAVHTPHIGGVLHRYRPVGDRLVAERMADGLTNHVIGSRDLDMAAWHGDVLFVPTQDRMALRRVAWHGSETEAPPTRLPAPAARIMAWPQARSMLALLTDGRVVRVG